MNNRTKSIVVLIVLGILIAGVLLAWGPKPSIDIEFLGYTPWPDGSVSAKCQVRNLTKGHIVIMTLSPQFHLDDGWRWGQPDEPVVGTKTFIAAGMVANVDFPPPNQLETWRAAAIVRTHRQEDLELKARHLLRGQVSPRIRLFGRYSYSSPVPPPVEPYRPYRPPGRPELAIPSGLAEPSDPPNDGPATSVGNADASGGGRHR